MKLFIKNIITFFAAITGFIGGTLWAIKTNWDPEPIILVAVSSLEIIGFILLKSVKENELPNTNFLQQPSHNLNNSNTVNVIVNKENDLSTTDVDEIQKALCDVLP